jgi:hypothetical protein
LTAPLTHLLRTLIEPLLNGFENTLARSHRVIRRSLAVVQR